MGRQREQNYSHSPAYLTTFYREGVLLKNKVQNLTEAVFKVYKIASHSPVSDQAKLLKMSRLSNVEAKDSLLVKVKSGIQACFQMDIMKDMPSFLIPDAGDNGYLYTCAGSDIHRRPVCEMSYTLHKRRRLSTSLLRRFVY